MAIIIPSAKTYERQNPKVRDNIIERVEVSAKEVLPDNQFETSIFNEDVYGTGTIDIRDPQKSEPQRTDGGISYATRIYAVYRLIPYYYNIQLKIPKVADNHYISHIFYQPKKEGDETVPQIKHTLSGSIYTEENSIISTPIGTNGKVDFSIDNTSPDYKLSKTGIISNEPILEYTFETNSKHDKITASIKDIFTGIGTILSPTFVEYENYYGLSFNLLYQYEEIKFGGYYEYTYGDNNDITNIGSTPSWVETKSNSVKTKIEKIEITVYGNTIGIDLKDKTLYIPETDKTSKKVFSVDGNEFLQNVIQRKTDYVYYPIDQSQYTYEFRDDENQYATFSFDESLWEKRVRIKYLSDGQEVFDLADASAKTTIYNGGYHIDKIIGVDLVEGGELYDTPYNFYSVILDHYKKGKETATIRCSIGDYFDKYGVKRINTNKFSRNLLPKKYLFGTTYTQHGVTATVLPDGGVRIQGKNTHNERIFFNLAKQYFSDKAIICYEGTTSATDGVYTVSMFGEGLSNVAFGYNEHNDTTWLSILPSWKVDAIVYPMLNKGGFIPYEAHDSSMVFQIGDQVIPMVYGADGKDRPMSTYQDGTAKVFQVLGTKIFYDGAVWQELSLQEV